MRRCEHTGRRAGVSRRCVLPEGHGMPLHSYGQLAEVSDARAVDNREYLGLRVDFLAAHAWCQFPLGCVERSSVVHHKRGRFGRRLNDREWWAASCEFHNDFAETRTGEALACGWLVRIEGAA